MILNRGLKKPVAFVFLFVISTLALKMFSIHGQLSGVHPPIQYEKTENAINTRAINTRVTRPNEFGNRRNGSDVILLAYMRTGSTYLGDILSWNKEVFYWMEPLLANRQWNYLQGPDLLCNTLKPLCERIPDTDPRSSKHAVSLLNDIFACKISGLSYAITVTHIDPYLTVPSWMPYMECIKSKGMSKNHPTCVFKLSQSCQESRHRLVKVLRMDLKQTSELLNTNPRLKIVQLFRDPRGSLNSHLYTKWYSSNIDSIKKVEDDIIVLCSRLRNDISVAKNLIEKYPGRVKIVQYEDMDGTDEKYRKLMEFIDFDVDKNIPRGNRSLGYLKRKAGFHPFSYRDNLMWETVKTLNKHCSDVYEMLGLRMFDSESELKNMSISAIIDTLPYMIIE